jgi:hypothetical protein
MKQLDSELAESPLPRSAERSLRRLFVENDLEPA